MTVKPNYFKFTLIFHPITYLTLNPKAREFPSAVNNHSDNEKAKGCDLEHDWTLNVSSQLLCTSLIFRGLLEN